MQGTWNFGGESAQVEDWRIESETLLKKSHCLENVPTLPRVANVYARNQVKAPERSPIPRTKTRQTPALQFVTGVDDLGRCLQNGNRQGALVPPFGVIKYVGCYRQLYDKLDNWRRLTDI
jgi:hypothetical protein